MRLSERSSGSPRFSRQRRIRLSWSSSMMMRASEPPMKWRRSFGFNLMMRLRHSFERLSPVSPTQNKPRTARSPASARRDTGATIGVGARPTQ